MPVRVVLSSLLGFRHQLLQRCRKLVVIELHPAIVSPHRPRVIAFLGTIQVVMGAWPTRLKTPPLLFLLPVENGLVGFHPGPPPPARPPPSPTQKVRGT